MAGKTETTRKEIPPEHLEGLNEEQQAVILLIDTLCGDVTEDIKAVRAAMEAELKALREALDKQAEKPLDPRLEGTLNRVLVALDTPRDTGLEDALRDCVAALQHKRVKPPRGWYVWGAGVLASGVLGALLAWAVVGGSAEIRKQAQLGAQMEKMLLPRFDSLPAQWQTAIANAYLQAGMQPPSITRRGK